MQGTITTGQGVAADFVAAVDALLTEALGFEPFPGTFNLRTDDPAAREAFPATILPYGGDEHCDGVHVRSCSVAGVRAAVLEPIVDGYPPEKVELVAPVRLRTLFGFEDGDTLSLGGADERWFPAGPTADATAVDEFDAVVFDLDGTLVDLDVDWPVVHDAVRDALSDVMDGPLRGYTRAEIMGLARETGRYGDLVDTIAEAEFVGARTATPLPLLSVLADLDCPVAVCTANAGAAAELALSRFDAIDAVDVIVARETVPQEKPHPRPLEAALAALSVRPGDALFVGDDRGDADTAGAAGASFLHPDQLVPEN